MWADVGWQCITMCTSYPIYIATFWDILAGQAIYGCVPVYSVFMPVFIPFWDVLDLRVHWDIPIGMNLLLATSWWLCEFFWDTFVSRPLSQSG